jgi:hypothetical protein
MMKHICDHIAATFALKRYNVHVAQRIAAILCNFYTFQAVRSRSGSGQV